MCRLKHFALAVAGLVLFVSLVAVAAKEFTPPHASHARSYAAHDEHPMEHVTVAIDPYDRSDKASIFRTDWRDHGYLPVFFVISNDTDQPIALTSMKVELITANRSKLQPASDEDLYRRIGKLKRRGDEASRNPLPIPLPRKGPDVGISKDARGEVEAAQFHAMAVEPHASQSGFLFFDVQGIRDPLPGAHVYVTGLKNSSGQELMYFEIPLEKYLEAGVR